MDFDEPVDQNRASFFLDISLLIHICAVWLCKSLSGLHVPLDVATELTDMVDVIQSLAVNDVDS